MKHTWQRDSNGEIEIIQLTEDNHHTGPICTACGFSFCQDCTPDGYRDNSCPGPKSDDFDPKIESGKYIVGFIGQVQILETRRKIHEN